MNSKKLALALAVGTALLAATGAQAHDGRWDPGVVVRAAYPYNPYYYAPRYVAPAPYYYAPPAPVVYGRIPVGHHASIGISVPLF
jgi:hypothetical protein